MLITLLQAAFIIVVLGALVFEYKARKRYWRVTLINNNEKENSKNQQQNKPKQVPNIDPIFALIKNIFDLITGKGLRGEGIDKVCRNLLEKDINGSKKLKWMQNYFFGIHFINIWNPDIVREILFSKDDLIGKQDFGQELTKRFIGESILSVDGDEWKRQKKLLSPAFSHEHLKYIAPEIVIVTDQLVEKLSSSLDKPLKIHPILQQATLDIIGKSGFGINFGALMEDKKSEELENYENLMKELQNPIHFLTKIDSLLGTKKKLYKLLEGFERFTLKLIDKKRQTIQEKGNEFIPKDILDLLVMGHDSDDGILGDRQLIHNLNTFFVAGHETTAAAVSATIHLLSDHQDIQNILFDEINRVCGEHPPTYDHLKLMDYLHNTIKEALRLFPPAPVIVRKAKEDTVIGGYNIPKDSTLALFLYTIHRDPQYWENPDQFDPSRFNDENKEKRHRYAWVPFSLGPRQCIGNNLAFMEMKMMLIRILQNFIIENNPNAEKPNVPFMANVVQIHPKATVILRKRN